MEQVKKERRIITKVNDCVCDKFNVKVESLYNKDRTSKATMARGFAIYILHKKMGFSISSLSREYNRIPRTIFWHNSKIGDYITCYPKYKEMLESICDSLK